MCVIDVVLALKFAAVALGAKTGRDADDTKAEARELQPDGNYTRFRQAKLWIHDGEEQCRNDAKNGTGSLRTTCQSPTK
jgi:hypothetical protein